MAVFVHYPGEVDFQAEVVGQLTQGSVVKGKEIVQAFIPLSALDSCNKVFFEPTPLVIPLALLFVLVHDLRVPADHFLQQPVASLIFAFDADLDLL